MMKYSTYTLGLVRALESASPASCKTPATFIDSIRQTINLEKRKNLEMRSNFQQIVLHNEKQTPKTMKQAIITLLPKKGDLDKLKHWRLISVICLDYKILKPSSHTRRFLVSFYESSYESLQEAYEIDVHTYKKRS